ncbi:MAG TPA: hypothetical protein VF271_04160 [Rhodanobacteraceae bacterium]
MENATFTLLVPFAPIGEPWVVRRARTVVETFDSREDALAGARALAMGLARRMGTSVRVRTQDAKGAWCTLYDTRNAMSRQSA